LIADFLQTFCTLVAEKSFVYPGRLGKISSRKMECKSMPSQIEDTVNKLRVRILAGDFSVGCLPFREDLARSYGTSKHVIGKAIKQLRAEELLILQGTRVYTQSALDEEAAFALAFHQ